MEESPEQEDRPGASPSVEEPVDPALGPRDALLVVDVQNDFFPGGALPVEEGDRVLKEFARSSVKSCRESDVVARLGGDEFCGLFVGSNQEELAPAFARLRESIKAVNAKRDPKYPISFSGGAAVFDPNDPVELDELMRRADEAMYERKRQMAAAEPGSAKQTR